MKKNKTPRKSRHLPQEAPDRVREIALAKRLGIQLPKNWDLNVDELPPGSEIRFIVAMYYRLRQEQPEFRRGPGRKRGSMEILATDVTSATVRKRRQRKRRGEWLPGEKARLTVDEKRRLAEVLARSRTRRDKNEK